MADNLNPQLAAIVRAWLDDRETLLSLIFDEVAEQLASAVAAEIVSNLLRSLKPDRGQELFRRAVLLAGGSADFLNELIAAGKLQPEADVQDMIADLYSIYTEGSLFLGNSFMSDVEAPRIVRDDDQAAGEGGAG